MASDARERPSVSRLVLAALFVTAGTLHLAVPAPYLRIMPPSLPAPGALVFISGICEILGGVGVLLPAVRRAAGFGLIALLIAVFPANIRMATLQEQASGWSPYTWVLLLRLPLQLVLIRWVWLAAITPPRPLRAAA